VQSATFAKDASGLSPVARLKRRTKLRRLIPARQAGVSSGKGRLNADGANAYPQCRICCPAAIHLCKYFPGMKGDCLKNDTKKGHRGIVTAQQPSTVVNDVNVDHPFTTIDAIKALPPSRSSSFGSRTAEKAADRIARLRPLFTGEQEIVRQKSFLLHADVGTRGCRLSR
jgi:hypothetical protein